jgi:hypothetical protein
VGFSYIEKGERRIKESLIIDEVPIFFLASEVSKNSTNSPPPFADRGMST